MYVRSRWQCGNSDKVRLVPDPDLRAAIKLYRALEHHFRRWADGSVEPTLEGKHTLGEMAARAP
jgi:hypothetical protein